jgi:hypothetical protein
MTDSNTGNNAQSSPNPPSGGPTYQDWREQRWEWRQKMREARHSRPFHGLFPGTGFSSPWRVVPGRPAKLDNRKRMVAMAAYRPGRNIYY